MTIDKTLLDQLMEGRAPGDLFGKEGILSELTKALAARALSTELDQHLDEDRSTAPDEGANRPVNRRNGASQKTVTTDSGKVVLDIPRDRNGTFDPLLIGKYQRRFPDFDRKRQAVLIPRGSTLQGRYRSDVSGEDGRVVVSWDEVTLQPGGTSKRLSSGPRGENALVTTLWPSDPALMNRSAEITVLVANEIALAN